MRMLDLQVGSKSIRNALWLSVSWNLCLSLQFSLSLSCSPSRRVSFSYSLSLSNNIDALDQLQPSEEEEAMLRHLCVSMCVQASMSVCVCGS